MPEQGAIRVDHDVAQAKANQLSSLAQSLKEDTKKGIEAITQAMQQESSQHTRDGQPAPLFRDTNDALQRFLERVQKNVDVIVERMENDSDAIRQYSRETQEVDDSAAAALNKTDVAEH